jgi:hypothetical protein
MNVVIVGQSFRRKLCPAMTCAESESDLKTGQAQSAQDHAEAITEDIIAISKGMTTTRAVRLGAAARA